MIETGLVELDAHAVLQKVNKLIKEREEYWAEEDNRQIQAQINYTADSHWFGLVRGRTIGEKEAIRLLNKSDDMFGWRCYVGGAWVSQWKIIRSMCSVSIAAVGTNPKVYLSGTQIRNMED